MSTETQDHYAFFVDSLCLVYHEARNVRHLIRSKLIDAKGWDRIISQPTNRDKAWNAIQPVRRKALEKGNPEEAAKVFTDRYGVGLSYLKVLYFHSGWKGSRTGGNAWSKLTNLVEDLLCALTESDQQKVEETVTKLQLAHHNTGSFQDKLEKLDAALVSQA
ncbi:hypothetical protein ACFLTX_02980 [Chloroflexota bacterium]